MKTLIAALLLGTLVFGGAWVFVNMRGNISLIISIYFPNDPSLVEPFAKPSDRVISIHSRDNNINWVLKELLQGPTESELAQGYFSTFDTKTIPLIRTYQKIEVKNNIAYVYFDSRALEYLNAPAAEQLVTKESIEKTLQSFNKQIEKIEYVIDGEVYTEWDA